MIDEIGEWYDAQRKKADNIREKIVQTEALMKANCKCITSTYTLCLICKESDLLLRQLNRELELALYVGD